MKKFTYRITYNSDEQPLAPGDDGIRTSLVSVNANGITDADDEIAEICPRAIKVALVRIEKRVSDLIVNDVLDSGTTVIERPYDSVQCPKGKTNLTVEMPNGTRRGVVWGKATLVALKINIAE